MTLIYVPGRGYMDSMAYLVDRKVTEYDERLYFSRNQETGDWCIFLKNRTDADLPLIGWREVPSSDTAIKWLYEHDSVRHGEKMLDDMNRRNKDIDKQHDEKRSELTGEIAEHIEVVTRWTGNHPNPRIFVPELDS